ncbi:MAG: prolipoprotein diacylglyceryl transferase, partial [Chloroflexota bacterium]|nr:prolipoprotein diacylglyceryl transferase [Chloroflexota bacterium]
MHIGMNPDLLQAAGFVVSWHGFMTFVSVALAVFLIARWGRKVDILPDAVYSTAVWAIIGGIIGARVVHVIDRWDFYRDNLTQIP